MTETDESLRTILAELEAGFNEKDADRMAACLAEDSIWVNPAGDLTRGRPSIHEKFKTSLATYLSDYYARYDLLSVIDIGDDVAVVHARQRPVTKDGLSFDGRTGSIASYVCHLTNDGWRIVSAQNTIEDRKWVESGTQTRDLQAIAQRS